MAEKSEKGNLNASHLGLVENAGLPKQDSERDLYGNGVIIVPNVHAVMAWAARMILAANEIEAVRNCESLGKRGRDDSPTAKEQG